MSVAPNSGDGKITVPELLQRKSRAAGSYSNSQKITCLTAYDYPTARLLDEAGVDVILVGDSLGMVVLGHENTLSVTIDEMLHRTRMVQHFVDSDRQCVLVPQHDHTGRIADKNHVHAGFIEQARGRVVVRRQASDLLKVG